jgi:hypothetical protein
VLLVFLVSASALPAFAQSEVCADTIPLYSPDGFSVTYEVAPNPQRVDGVRLRWNDIPDSIAGCASLVIDPAVEAELGLEVRGDYRNAFDRNIAFSLAQPGVVGDPDQARLELTINNSHPNPAAGDLASILNLSSAGGIYRFAPEASGNNAFQVNSGIPPHVGDVAINEIARAADGSVTYAAVVGVPVVRSYDDGMTWEEPVERIFPPFSQRMTAMAVFPDEPNRLWVGVNGRGLWESTDGAETWAQIFPAGIGPSSNVTLLKFLTVIGPGGAPVERLYLGARGQTLAYSDDSALTFTAVGEFDVPKVNSSPTGATCTNLVGERIDVFDIELSPNDPSRVYLGVGRWGVYMGDTRDHSSWTPRFSGLVLCDTEGIESRPLGEQRTVVELEVLDLSGQDVLVAATETQVPPAGEPDLRSQTIIFVSTDGGLAWQTKGDGYPINADGDAVAITGLISDPRPGNELAVIASSFGAGIWELDLSGSSGGGVWVPVDFDGAAPIRNDRAATLYVAEDGDILVGTADSGIYQPGVWIDLTRALNRSAQSFSDVVQLGLQIRFNRAGVIAGGERFAVRAQNFRGYAVWRAVDIDRASSVPVWELIGLLDLANPETCIMAQCDELAQPQEVNCWSNKRANCFVPRLDEQEVIESWEFFDRDIFNGYTYWYAVSTFDFGYTGETSQESFDGGMVFSPRWPIENDPAAAIFNGLVGGMNYNGELFQVNVAAAPELRDDEVFVVPNPLVRSAGWDLNGASSIRIVNVTASSKAEIYTVAGDLVREIENVDFAGVDRGNIEWDTRNSEGEPVASGVYIYRVTDDQGGEILGRFTIIR